MIAHGDSHYFRIDRPLTAPTPASSAQLPENATRRENFGSPYVPWDAVTAAARDPKVVRFEQRSVDANRLPR